jgi:hypothetical protein
MYRSLAAFLTLVSVPFFLGTEATAKNAPSIKRAPVIKIVKPLKAEKAQESATIKTEVRTQSAVIMNDNNTFSAPEGALYTTSDDCG